MWRYRIGRFLQFLGLLILPFAIASELMEKVGLGQSLLDCRVRRLCVLRGRSASAQAELGVQPRPRCWLGLAVSRLGSQLWLKFELRSPPMRKEVEPLRNDWCLICGGRMTDYPQWHCVECGVIRYNT